MIGTRYRAGDLRGRTRWTVRPDGRGGTAAVHEQHVEVTGPLLRLLSVPGRPLLLANHALGSPQGVSPRGRCEPASEGCGRSCAGVDSRRVWTTCDRHCMVLLVPQRTGGD
jgi:hypothetical protein